MSTVKFNPADRKPYTREQKARFARLARMPDSAIDYSDIPELDASWVSVAQKAVAAATAPKKPVALRLDADVLEWFQAQGKGYQTRINAVLRSYKESAAARK